MGGRVILGNMRGFIVVGDYCLNVSFLANEVIGLRLENNRDS